jgi:hypothetical protein
MMEDTMENLLYVTSPIIDHCSSQLHIPNCEDVACQRRIRARQWLTEVDSLFHKVIL